MSSVIWTNLLDACQAQRVDVGLVITAALQYQRMRDRATLVYEIKANYPNARPILVDLLDYLRQRRRFS